MKSLIVRVIGENERRKRATVTYVCSGELSDVEWLKLKAWLLGEDVKTFPSEKLLTVNIVMTK